jgi:enoyl-CoA hydratase
MEVGAAGIAVITINRPEKLNALNRDVMAELRQAFEAAESGSAIRGLILTGAGEKAFVAGADIKELAAIDAVGAEGSPR